MDTILSPSSKVVIYGHPLVAIIKSCDYGHHLVTSHLNIEVALVAARLDAQVILVVTV